MERCTLPPNPPGIRGLLSSESRIVDDRFGVHPKCLTCLGRGTFRWRRNGETAEFLCPCDEQFLLHRYLSHCGVPLNFQRRGFDDLDLLSPEVDLSPLLGYYEDHERYLNAGFSLVLSGGKGNGKTLLGHLLLKRLAGAGVNCYATTFADMVSRFMGSWRDPERERAFDVTVRNAGVLYIDDLGRERNKGPNSVGENMLETVVRSRVANNQPTIITTNLSEQEIHAGYGGHTMSLLTEKSVVVTLSGSDLRDQIRQRALDEVDAGLTRPVVLA